MKYSIKISGGFAGIQQEFTGELSVSEEEKAELKRTFIIEQQIEINKNIRDAFNYIVELEIDDKLYKKSFDDVSIPEEIIELIDEVKRKQNL